MSRADEIMDVANHFILERGYSAFSYADIAGEIGIQKASIHYHFPSKANLVQSVVGRYRQQIKSNLALLDGMEGDPQEKLTQYLNYWEVCLEAQATDICLCALLASEIPILPDEVRSEIKAHFEELTDWFTRLLKESKVPLQYTTADVSDEEMAHGILAGIHGGMLAARTFNDVGQFRMIKSGLLHQIHPAK
ncbi:TetR/AcrR family transcriptional regulator [Paenibacillus sp. FSL E2-0178]|uniref:TetR/AcrR family transcriptional regulator n=1 Tax=Paenibacillus sp. FSL E2-0178 TaxID=2921361 RepID=UPI003158EA90